MTIKTKRLPDLSWEEWIKPRTPEEMKHAPKLTPEQSDRAVATGEAAAQAYDAYTKHCTHPNSGIRYCSFV